MPIELHLYEMDLFLPSVSIRPLVIILQDPLRIIGGKEPSWDAPSHFGIKEIKA